MERDEAIEKIKEDIKCTDYLEKSKNGMYCCPFCGSGHHKNKTGALEYHSKTNTVCCYACDKTGTEKAKKYDVLDLIQNSCGTDFNGAVEIGASKLGIIIDNKKTNAPRVHIKHLIKKEDELTAENEKVPKTDDNEATEAIADYSAYYEQCQKNYAGSNEAIAYMRTRGIDLELADRFQIGYDENYISPEAKKKQEAGEQIKVYPSKRIIIPVSSNYYIARAIEESNKVRYINEKGGGELGIFNQAALYENDIVFIVEGALDAMSIEEAGAAAVGLNSTSNVSMLLSLLEQQKTNAVLVVALDNDEAGNKARELLKNGLDNLDIKYIAPEIYGSCNDANEALTTNYEEFAKALQAAVNQADELKEKNDLDLFLSEIQSEKYKPAKTNIKFIDELLGGGIINQTLTVIMAAPAAGKTTLCQQIAEAMAANKRQVRYICLEMSREQMLAKSISSMMYRKGQKKTAMEILQGYNWSNEDKEQITAALREYEQTIYPYLRYVGVKEIGTNADGTRGDGAGTIQLLDKLRKIGETYKKKGEAAPAIILDYLHLLHNDTGSNIDKQDLIGIIVEGLKEYAMEYNTFVIAIAATNRTSNKGKLGLDSGRDSSNIDFAADYALTLNYEDVDNGKVAPNSKEADELKMEKPRRMILRVEKGRFIQAGKSVKINFYSANNMFYAPDEWQPAEGVEVPKFTNDKRSLFAPVKRV